MTEFIPFALPEIGEEEIESVVESLRSGWVTTGPKTKLFEQKFSEFFLDPALEAVAVNSATAGLHLALEALGIGPGDEVITTTHTFTASAEVARYLGADVSFVDVDRRSLNMCAEDLAQKITQRTKAIVVVHYAGLAVDMDPIIKLAKSRGIYVVEDAAHALPTTYKGRLVGTLDSDATVFSFYANKTMTTGEGGMVVTRSREIAQRMRIMRLHGMSRDAFDRFVSEKPAWYYEIVAPGFKYNLTDLAASIGIHQLRKLPAFWERRESMANRYFEQLKGLPIELPARAPDGDKHSWHLFVIRLTDDVSKTRDQVIVDLAELRIGTSVHYVPLHRQPYWRDRYGLTAEMFPNSDRAYQRMLSIPLYTSMSDAQQDRVIDALHRVLENG